MGWDAEDSVEWREQIHMVEGIGKESSVLGEDVGRSGCTTCNEAVFYQTVLLL